MDSQTESKSTVEDSIAVLKGIPTRAELLKLLEDWYYWITFKKLDGTERKMLCTLRPDELPKADTEDKLSQTKSRNLEDKVFVVWDKQAAGWRSFRYDRVTNVEHAQ